MKLRTFSVGALLVFSAAGCAGIVSENELEPENDHEWAAWPMPNPANAGLPNPASYTVSGETVKDNVTGLLWQRSLSAKKYNWAEAKDYCSSLSVDGITEWRLPSAIELVSIVDFTTSNPAINGSVFPGTPNAYFWSSSSFPILPAEGWAVEFGGGGTVWTDGSAVRCVHGTVFMPKEHYTIASGVVTDNATKLQWQRAWGSSQMTFPEAMAYCQKLNLNGTGWRLPSMKELQTIVDRKKCEPAIDSSVFSENAFVQTLFWSSSPVMHDPGGPGPEPGPAWAVDFHFFGGTWTHSTSPDFAVRCVR